MQPCFHESAQGGLLLQIRNHTLLNIRTILFQPNPVSNFFRYTGKRKSCNLIDFCINIFRSPKLIGLQIFQMNSMFLPDLWFPTKNCVVSIVQLSKFHIHKNVSLWHTSYRLIFIAFHSNIKNKTHSSTFQLRGDKVNE